ncbi:MAG: protoporphyrinogen oxidase HemJ [Helicobacteraceae bacterium]
MDYIYLKAFHIVSVVAWYAVLFYLPRLFVYHAENAANAEFVKVAKVMELKLYKYIGLPSFWATFGSGLALIFLQPDLLKSGGWLHAKILLLVFLAAYFFHLGKLRRALFLDKCTKSGKFFRAYNEVPTLFLFAIVIFAVAKPF